MVGSREIIEGSSSQASRPRMPGTALSVSALGASLGARDRHQDAQPQPQRHHRRAAVADEGQRHAHHRQDAADHAHVHEGVGEEDHGHRAGQQAREQRGRVQRDGQAAEDQEDEAGDQAQVAGQAELLGVGGEDEVGGALGNELQVRLRALHEALAADAAGADGDHALDDVEALAQRVLGRVEQRADALLLVVVQDRASRSRRRTAATRSPRSAPPRPCPMHHRRHDQLPRQAGEEDHRQAGRQHQQGGAQVGLLHDQADRHRQQHRRDHEVERRAAGLRAAGTTRPASAAWRSSGFRWAGSPRPR